MVNKKDNTTILGIRIRKREQAAPVKNNIKNSGKRDKITYHSLAGILF